MAQKNYSDDNCLCRAGKINRECPRHKALLNGISKDKLGDYEMTQQEKANDDRY